MAVPSTHDLDRLVAYAPRCPAADVDETRCAIQVGRRQAALALARIGPEARKAIPMLQKLIRDPDRLVRKARTRSKDFVGQNTRTGKDEEW